jgi:hypothetical protein
MGNQERGVRPVSKHRVHFSSVFGLSNAFPDPLSGRAAIAPAVILAGIVPIRRMLSWAILPVLVGASMALAFEVASGEGDWIWAWNQSNLGDFTGHMSAFRVDSLGSNDVICSGDNPFNRYIGATVPEWWSEQDYTYSGVIRFGGLGSRAGVSLYYQDTGNHYQVNIQSGDSDPKQGGFRLRRFNNGVEIQLIEDNTLEFKDNTWYPFRVTVESLSDRTRFQLEVNAEDGIHSLEYEDFSPDRFTSGRVGVRKKQGPDACWDDLTVVSLGGTPPPATATPTGSAPTPTSAPVSPTLTPTNPGGRRTRTPVSTGVASATPGPGTSTSTASLPEPTKTPRTRTPTVTPTP